MSVWGFLQIFFFFFFDNKMTQDIVSPLRGTELWGGVGGSWQTGPCHGHYFDSSLRDTLNDTLDEQLETSLEAVEHLNPGDVVPLQEREHLNSSFSAQLEASLDEEVSGSLQFTNLDQAQVSFQINLFFK